MGREGRSPPLPSSVIPLRLAQRPGSRHGKSGLDSDGTATLWWAGVGCGRLAPVITVLASVVAVIGTLIGSWSTYAFQRRAAARTRAEAREEHLRQERLSAHSAYAGAVTELKRAQITLWFRHRAAPRDEETVSAAQLESDRLGAAAETAAFRLRLVAEDPLLRPFMTAISSALGEIKHADDRRAVIAIEARFEEAVGAFLDAAALGLR